jgi:hypothetical protein
MSPIYYVGSQTIFAKFKFRPMNHPWPSPPTGKNNSELLLNEPCDTLVAFTNPMHLSCPNCGVRKTLFHSMKTEPPINDIALWPTDVSRSTEIYSQVTHRWPSWEPTCKITFGMWHLRFSGRWTCNVDLLGSNADITTQNTNIDKYLGYLSEICWNRLLQPLVIYILVIISYSHSLNFQLILNDWIALNFQYFFSTKLTQTINLNYYLLSSSNILVDYQVVIIIFFPHYNHVLFPKTEKNHRQYSVPLACR